MKKLESHKKSFSTSRRRDVPAVRDLIKTIESLNDEIARERGIPEEMPEPSVPELELEDKRDLEFKMALNQRVNNTAETWNFPERFTYLMPYSLRGTVRAVMFAEELGKPVKGLGSRHSYSKVVETDGVYIDMRLGHGYDIERHNETLDSLDQSALQLLRDTEDLKKYVDCPAGLSVEQVNYALCPDKARDKGNPLSGQKRRLYNMGGADIQQVAGAFSTGTHGSGGIYSSFHDMVRSILVVASGGNIYRVEPSNGITDRDKHEAKYHDADPIDQVTLKQEDELFYALVVSMGCFGIIHSMILEVAPMTNLHKDGYYHKSGFDKSAEEQITNYQLPDSPGAEEMIAIQINPYKVGRRKYRSYLKKIHRPTMEPRRNKRERSKRFWPDLFTNLNLTVNLIRALLNDGEVPKRRLIESALTRQDDNKDNRGMGVTDISYRVLQAGAGKLNAIGTGIEFAFTREEIIPALKLLFAHLEQQAERRKGYYVNGPVTVRYVRPSKAFLAPSNHKYRDQEVDLWFFVEVTRVNGKDEGDDERERKLFHHLQRMLELLGGRPHWGLNFDMEFTERKVRNWYPEFDQWKTAFHFFNPNGTFDNDFVRDMGLRVQA